MVTDSPSPLPFSQLGFDFELTYFDDPQINLPSSCVNWVTTTGESGRVKGGRGREERREGGREGEKEGRVGGRVKGECMSICVKRVRSCMDSLHLGE